MKGKNSAGLSNDYNIQSPDKKRQVAAFIHLFSDILSPPES